MVEQNTLIELLAWDSEFFGLPIGRATHRATSLNEEKGIALLAAAEERKLQCFYFEADPDDAQTVAIVERLGFHLVDVRVVLEHPFNQRPAPIPRYPISSKLVISPPREDELPRLQEIAAQIGHTSRFNFDRNFGPKQSERLYRLWIKNACAGLADVIFVARWGEESEAVGLLTCTLKENVGHIQLAGVHFDYRKRSVGTGLVQAALDWAKSQKASRMEVVTQARNIPAQRLYQQMGFFTKSMSLYYHKWMTDSKFSSQVV
jgi:ribosomal protein S18 acetylase RimI-like enzyme